MKLTKFRIKFSKNNIEDVEEYVDQIRNKLLEIQKVVDNRNSTDFPVDNVRDFIKLLNNFNKNVKPIKVGKEYYKEIISCKNFEQYFKRIFSDIEEEKFKKFQLSNYYKRLAEKLKILKNNRIMEKKN